MTTFKLVTFQRPHLVLALCVLIVFVSVCTLIINGVKSFKSSDLISNDERTKRSALENLDSESDFVFRRAVHKVSWSSNLQSHRQPKQFGLEDVFVSVKTSEKFHSTRLKVILDTWYNLAPKQVRHRYNRFN